ncbi:MAG TPA: glutathione S-transferase N-terminal domain-containing protein [Polyangiaceae bacterium]|nr:glutathione S-transferase N-terminal domain-containing protein [Polyangiaceae bacterium]
MQTMIDLYTWTTPNGFKVSIALEELGLPYRAHAVDIGRGEQFDPKFLAISPNNKIPAIVDDEGPDGKRMSLFESGAILLYLASKTNKLLPSGDRARWEVTEWLFWQMASVGPMLGQAAHFRRYAPQPIEYAITRYTNETKRLYGVLERRLDGRDYIAGEYSIADIAAWPWMRNLEGFGLSASEFPRVAGWIERIASRPAVARGTAVPKVERPAATPEEVRENLFGKKQYERS